MTVEHAEQADQDQGLDEAIFAYLQAVEAGQQPEREEWLSRYPTLAPALREFLGDQDRFERLAAVGAVLGIAPGQPPGIAALANSGGILGDFELGEEIGRGGMGIVYRARQLSLKRTVALKVLPLTLTMDARHLQRFHIEAEAAAKLHHTNIVPVYIVGSERGVHFYAMQFIEGRDLASVIADLRGPSQPRPLGSGENLTAPYTPLPNGRGSESTQAIAGLSTERSKPSSEYFRTVARLGIQAAEALDHAHQMGIVHRDIKPANLLVDDTGRLWITDFGLAQIQTDTRLTMTGDLVGTLRYMSPEQALAKRVVVDHRTDVYSLGATLYELLTLQPVFTGDDRQELLRQLTFEEPRRLRRFNRAIPAELETIVLKALEKDPVDRYATAEEVAADLRFWLHDKPILARPPGPLERARKWVKRHKPLVTLAVALLTVALAGFAVSTTLVWREKQRTELEKEQTQAALAKAEVKTRLARRAVNEMYTEVAEKWLADTPHMTEVQRQFLRRALAFYEELSKESGTDPEVRLETASAYRRMGMLCDLLESPHITKAEGYLRLGEQLARNLADEFPEVTAFREEQFRSTFQLGVYLWGRSRLDEAEGPLRRASFLASRLAIDFPNVPTHQHDLAGCLHILAEVLYRAHPDEAEATYLEAIRIQRGLVTRFPDVPGYAYHLVAIQGDRIGFLAASGRLETPEACRLALAELDEVMGLCPRNRGDRPRPDRYYPTVLACLCMDLGLLQDAEAPLDRIMKLRQKECADYPGNAANRIGLAMTAWKQGRLLTLMGRTAEAKEAYLQAVASHRIALQTTPDSAFRRYELALMLGELSWHYLLGPAHKGGADSALAAVQEALDLAPDGGAFLQALRGLAYYRLGKSEQAIIALNEARATLAKSNRSQGWRKADDTFLVQAAARKESASPALILFVLAMTYRQSGENTKAADCYQQAQDWRKQHHVAPQEAEALKAIETEAAVALGLAPPMISEQKPQKKQ